MQSLLGDLRYSLRTLRRKPGFALFVIVILGLGIGANTAIFTIFHAVLIRPLPYNDENRLVMVWGSNLQTGQRYIPLSPADFRDLRDQSRAFAQIAAVDTVGFNLSDSSNPVRVQGSRVSASLFTLLNIRPPLGRPLAPRDEEPGATKVAVLSYGLWSSRFVSDPGIIDKIIMLNGESYTVVGILPADFSPTFMRADIWVPLPLDQHGDNRGNRFLRVMARLNPGTELKQAEADTDSIMRGLEQHYPDTNRHLGAQLIGLRYYLVRQSRTALLMLLGAVAFVLLISCANVASLLLSRAALRQKEVAIRVAIGASRARLIRQLLIEALLLSLAAGALGVLLAHWGVGILSASIPDHIANYIPSLRSLGINGQVLGITFLVSILTGFVFGLAPAVRASSANLSELLKEFSPFSVTRRHNRIQSLLVVSEVALALVLLVGAGLMMRTFFSLVTGYTGFDPRNILTMQLSLQHPNYHEAHRRAAFFQQVLERVNSVPGVESSALISDLPLTGDYSYTRFTIADRPHSIQDPVMQVSYHTVSADAFETLRIPLLRGRYFHAQDNGAAQPVAIINQALARRFWSDQDPIGKRIKLAGPESHAPWVSIVGLVEDIKHSSEEMKEEPELYLPHLQSPTRTMSIILRVSPGMGELSSRIRDEILALDRGEPVYNIKSMEQVLLDRATPHRLLLFLFGAFAISALALAAVGVYAVMGYVVNQRVQEIGLRMALGARPVDVMILILRKALVLAVAGMIIGLVGAFALTRLMSSLIAGVSVTDPATFFLMGLLLLTVTLIASFIPARKGTKVEPITALRQ